MSKFCPCGKKKPTEKCCDRFLSGRQIAKTPEQLMRSRYVAYLLGGHGKYLLATWFPATAVGLDEQMLSAPDKTWIKLEVHGASQEGDQGQVEFSAYYRAAGDELEVLHEKSVFQRLAGRWFYVGGEVDVSTAPA